MKVLKLQFVILALFFLFMSTTAQAEQQSFLCSAEESTGYDYTNGRWLRERFRADTRYLVKQVDAAWTVYEYSSEIEYTDCIQNTDDVIKCFIGGDFIMDLNTMKFSITDTRPYVHSTRTNRDSVVLTLGVCVDMK